VALFYLPEPPTEDPMPEDFRRLPGVEPAEFAPDTLVTFRRARRLQHIAVEALDLGRPGVADRLPRFDAADDREAAGEAIRHLLGVSVAEQTSWPSHAEAYRQWRLATERAGILVLQFRMPPDNARGFSLWHERVPAVVVNSTDSPAGRCFTLFHEVAHLTLRTPGVCLVEPRASLEATGRPARVERFCDAAAAAVLLPLRDEVVSDTVAAAAASPSEAVVQQAALLKVSREAMLWRMVDAGRMSREAARRIADRWAAERAEAVPRAGRSGGPSLPLRRLAERGPAFASGVLDALEKGRVTYPDASEFLDLPTTQLERCREILSRGLRGPVADE